MNKYKIAAIVEFVVILLLGAKLIYIHSQVNKAYQEIKGIEAQVTQIQASIK